MMYEDRWDAALRLIDALRRYAGEDCVVLAVPRGGVPIGYAIARAYGFPLDLLLTKKIGHPANPELAIGAVCLEGESIDPSIPVDESYIRKTVPAIRRSLEAKRQKFMGPKAPVPLRGRTVIIVDDGIATGQTLMASIGMIRRSDPARIVVAVPVAPRQTVRKFKALVDDFICPSTPEDFYAVGQFYQDFSEVTDDDVTRLMTMLDTGKDTQAAKDPVSPG